MVSWTVGADGIAQKAYSAEEMHPEQNEIQPARGPRETSSLRPSNGIMPIRINSGLTLPFRNLSTWTNGFGRVRMNGALPLLTRYIFNSLGPMAKTSTSMN